MHSISVDPRTYHRLAQFARSAGVSLEAAACDAIDNWMNITSDPHLAMAALNAIAMTEPDADAGAASPVSGNVVFINASRDRATRQETGASRKRGETRKHGGLR